MQYDEIFGQILEYRNRLRVIFVGTSDENGLPNCVPKMLIDIDKPNKVFFIDFKLSRTYKNIHQNWQSSLSFMDDKTLTGFRLNGFSQIVDSGREFISVREKWNQKIIAVEAERMIERIKGIFSARQTGMLLPKNFVIVKFIAEEASIVRPGHVLKAMKNSEEEASEKFISHPIKKIVELETQLTERLQAEQRLKEREKKFEKTIVEDELTGLYNRRGFVTLVEQQLKLAKRSGKESFLIFSDLDRLKPINDTFGHHVGDQALVDTARILKETFRESDIMARIGGDEFAIAVVGCKREEVESATHRLKENIEKYNREKRAPYQLGLSLGIAGCKSNDSASLQELLKRADHRMYEEKIRKKTAGE